MKLYHRKVLPSIPKRGKQQTVQRYVQGKTARNVHNDNIQAGILTDALKEKQTLSEQRNYGMIIYQRNLVWETRRRTTRDDRRNGLRTDRPAKTVMNQTEQVLLNSIRQSLWVTAF